MEFTWTMSGLWRGRPFTVKMRPRHIDGIHVDDERALARPPFHREDARHGSGIEGIGAQTVDRFGRERDDHAAANKLRRTPQIGVCPLARSPPRPLARHPSGSSALPPSTAVLPLLL